MTALDLNPLDERLLSFTKYIGTLLKAKKVYGVHIIPAVLISDVIKVEAGHYLRPVAPAVGKIEKEVERLTKKWIGDTDMDYSTKVIEGIPHPELLKLTEAYHADLLILGKRKNPVHGRITTKKIARKVDCDLLIVPEDSFALVEKIVVPIDFSASSGRALERAIALSEQLNLQKKIECVHVLDVPGIKHTASKIYESPGFTGLPDSIVKKLEEFKETYCPDNDEIKFSFIGIQSNSIASTLHDFAKRKNADLLVMGAKGHSIGERILFGSVAEAMVDTYFIEALYIVR